MATVVHKKYVQLLLSTLSLKSKQLLGSWFFEL